ncbi:serotransferrin-like [Ctenodactylus gundi]
MTGRYCGEDHKDFAEIPDYEWGKEPGLGQRVSPLGEEMEEGSRRTKSPQLEEQTPEPGRVTILMSCVTAAAGVDEELRSKEGFAQCLAPLPNSSIGAVAIIVLQFTSSRSPIDSFPAQEPAEIRERMGRCSTRRALLAHGGQFPSLSGLSLRPSPGSRLSPPAAPQPVVAALLALREQGAGPAGGADAAVLLARRMKVPAGALLACAALGLCLAVPEKTVRWCAVSEHEASKCSSLRDNIKKVLSPEDPHVACVKKTSYLDCIKAIAANEADAVTLDAGLVYEAGLTPNNLRPVAAEVYGSQENPQTFYYAVALVKKGSGFQLNQLQGKKSCHTGLGRSAGWNIPIGLLYCDLPEPRKPLEKAVASFFSGSCVPCADGVAFPQLCQLCPGCGCSSLQQYFGYSGAFKCLKDDAGDVAFVKHLTIFENLPQKADRDQYELLCTDNTRRPVDEYEQCYLAKVPSHAVVARTVDGKEDLIWELLSKAQEHFGRDKASDFKLFSSPHGKNLLFKDSAQGFLRVPSRMDFRLYLGYKYVTAVRNMREGICPETSKDECKTVKWCALSHHERLKCDEWSVNSGGQIECESAETTEDCIAKIVNGEADAMSLDGGFVYIAGQCGLVPVMAENYGYFAVAVVKKSDADITWNNLEGKKSCHTAVDRTAGWNIPMGLLYNRINHCKFDEFFSQGCAPGSMKNSSLCELCIGPSVCTPNNKEAYYGYTGAFRCLVEKGDVAFVKHTTPLDITNGKIPDAWAKGLQQADFELLCPDGTRKPVDQYKTCHLAQAPNHAVVARKDKAKCVHDVLSTQQREYGSHVSDCSSKFCLFQSETKDLLFKDNTKCLVKLPDDITPEKYLGETYVKAVENLEKCSTSRLLEACTFHKV